MAKVTLKFLSELSGVSTTIVSKIVNNKDVRVSKEKRLEILELARKYHYVPNATAVSLATKKSKMIGLLIPDISNAFFAEIAKNVEAILSTKGYNLIFCNTNDDKDLQEKYANLLLARGVEALIFCLAMGTRGQEEFISRFLEQDIPLVAFDRFEAGDYSTVTTDNLQGVYDGVDYLVKLGHRNIACIAGPIASTSTKNRLQGYLKALSDNNITTNENYITYADYRYDGGYESAKKLLENKDITAIVAFNDLMAYGAYKAIAEAGLKVPDDISVIGFDDLLFSSMMGVPLTTIHQDTKEMSKCIAQLVFDVLEGKKEKEDIKINPRLIIRSSVKNSNK